MWSACDQSAYCSVRIQKLRFCELVPRGFAKYVHCTELCKLYLMNSRGKTTRYLVKLKKTMDFGGRYVVVREG
jgi:hypothetical protein